jgi:hypothetical protein
MTTTTDHQLMITRLKLTLKPKPTTEIVETCKLIKIQMKPPSETGKLKIQMKTPAEIDKLTLQMKPELIGNDKRKVSCQKVGHTKKVTGHQRETDFKTKYNPNSLSHKISYGPTSDAMIQSDHPICHRLKQILGVTNFNCSNKSGNNIQLTLGRIPELDVEDNLSVLSDRTQCHLIFQKYLKKIHSQTPADLLVYHDVSRQKWIFFNIDDVVDYIVNHVIWRKLASGRIKGDFIDQYARQTQYITYEYRETHKSHFLGMNGNKGIAFIDLLVYKIKYVEDDF